MIEFTNAPRNICIFRLSAIGDVTHILPVIHTLKKVWPETRLTWVIGKLEYQLVKNLQDIEFIIFDKSLGWKAYLELRRQVRHRKFDILLMMQAALRASIASLMIPAQHKLGFDRARAVDYQWIFSNHQITGDTRVHVLETFFQFLEVLGISDKYLCWDLPIDETDRLYAEKLVNRQPTAVINPCSSARKNNWRNWSTERYVKVIDYLHDKGLKVLLTGGPSLAETDFCQIITRQSKTAPLNLAGKTSLGQLLALIKQAQFLIAPDTGPAHMGTIVDTPVIGLFASSNPTRTGPYKSQQYLVNQYPNALQQFNHKTVDAARWGERVREPQVMDSISVDDVKLKIDALI